MALLDIKYKIEVFKLFKERKEGIENMNEEKDAFFKKRTDRLKKKVEFL